MALTMVAQTSAPGAIADYNAWIATLPEYVRKRAEQYPGGAFYRIKEGFPLAGGVVQIMAFKGNEKEDIAAALVCKSSMDFGDKEPYVELRLSWLEPISFDEAFPEEDTSPSNLS